MDMKMLASILFAFAATGFGAAVPTKTTEKPPVCTPQRICADYINDCGHMYGGCFTLACQGDPWPTFTPPPCPTTTTTTAATPTPTCVRKCVDYINDCGKWYGGCYDDCPGTEPPVFTDPGCDETNA